MSKRSSLFFFALFAVSLSTLSVSAQTGVAELKTTIAAKDVAFWKSYNACDIDSARTMFTTDVEFYHDKGGPTIGLDNFVGALKKGLCGDPNSRLRREPVPRTVEIYPLEDHGKIYGAIIQGEHVFYVTQKGKPEFLDGRARFLQMWLVSDGVWKMSRILSYDHGPAAEKGGAK